MHIIDNSCELSNMLKIVELYAGWIKSDGRPVPGCWPGGAHAKYSILVVRINMVKG
jgi:hypothetical protein